ncbi:MAG TPA: DUF1311 domain-containing protein [Alphaproteobacteria bacterium]|nr:DUF1311 domain-containing protein [Alphaproteobacteria bacterium]HQS93979.1 DUF1311 domain-containing protein [Alphaproteobacteria bacterium]
MKYFSKTVCAISVLSILGPLYLEAKPTKSSPYPISKKLDHCLNQSATTLEMSNCFGAAQKEWDTALNMIYKKLLNTIQDNDLKESLREIQRNWIISRDSQFLFLHQLYKLTGGTMSVINEASSRTKIIKDRVLELTDIYNSAYNREGN